jgi:hypothetical protein
MPPCPYINTEENRADTPGEAAAAGANERQRCGRLVS